MVRIGLIVAVVMLAGAGVAYAAGQISPGGPLGEVPTAPGTVPVQAAYRTQTALKSGELTQTQDQDRLRWCSDVNAEGHVFTPTHVISNTVHPVGQKLADKWVDVFEGPTYDDIMAWFCEGYGFGEIQLVLRIAETEGVDPEVIFAMHTDDDMSWGAIQQELGQIGTGEPRGIGKGVGKPAKGNK
jgi:hypothetical protein